MNRYTSLLIILVLGVVAFVMIHVMTMQSKKESFNDDINNDSTKQVNPHRLYLAPNPESCENLLDKRGFVSVQEFMDGSRYRCY